MRSLIIILATLVALVGCAVFEPADCRKADLATYADAVESQVATYRQQVDLTAATPRVGLGPALQRLLDIQTATRDLAAPGCVADFHSQLLAAMQNYQQAFQDFAAQRGTDALLAGKIANAKNRMDAAAAALPAIKAGTPPPTAETLSSPEPGVVSRVAFLSPSVGGGSGNVGVLCPADAFEIIARQNDISGASWAHVRVTAIGEADATCAAIATGIGRAAIGADGWLLDSEVFAP